MRLYTGRMYGNPAEPARTIMQMSIAAKLQSATFGTHLTQFPSGKFGFTGRIPDELAFEASNPKYIQDAKNHGAGLVSKVAANEGGYLRTRTWETRKAAQAALDDYNKRHP